MNRPTILMMIAAAAMLMGAACSRETARTGEQTQTIERPAPRQDEIRPDELTQTVELDDGRSEDEGASIREAESEVTGTTTTTTATTATTTTAPSRTPPPRKQ